MRKILIKITPTLIALFIVFANTGANRLIISTVSAQTPASSIFGKIEPPPGVNKYQTQVGGDNIGLILFLSNLVRLITIVAGIWTMFNFVLAGIAYISASGDAGKTEKAAKNITNSIIGLAIIAFSYTIAGLAGYLIFGDASYILNPQLVGPQ